MLCLLPLLLAAPPESLVRFLPPDANAMVVVDTPTVGPALQAQALTPVGGVPNWVGTYVAGVDMLLSGPVARSRAAIIELSGDRTVAEVGLVPPGAAKIGGLPASTDQRSATLLQITPTLVGVLRPSDPEGATAWAEQLQKPRLAAASYLRDAAAVDGDVLLALSLEKSFDEDALTRFVDAHESLDDPNLAATAATARGMTLALDAADIRQLTDARPVPARLRIDFAESPAAEADSVRDLIAAVLEEMFLALPALSEASARTDGRSVLIEVPLDRLAMENVVAMATPPRYQPLQLPEPPSRQSANQQAANQQATTNTQSPPAGSGSVDVARAQASYRYLSSVEEVLDRFERAAEASRPEQRTAAWIGRFNRNIENLDETNVDRAVLAYGRRAEDTMRKLAASLQGQRLAIDAAQKQLTYRYQDEPVYAPLRYNVFGQFGGVSVGVPYAGGFGGVNAITPAAAVYGYGYRPAFPGRVGVLPPVTQVGTRRRVTDSNIRTIRREQAEAIREGGEERLELWTDLREQANEIEAQMQQRYGAAFGP